MATLDVMWSVASTTNAFIPMAGLQLASAWPMPTWSHACTGIRNGMNSYSPTRRLSWADRTSGSYHKPRARKRFPQRTTRIQFLSDPPAPVVNTRLMLLLLQMVMRIPLRLTRQACPPPTPQNAATAPNHCRISIQGHPIRRILIIM
jgi:hypothetical protein